MKITREIWDGILVRIQHHTERISALQGYVFTLGGDIVKVRDDLAVAHSDLAAKNRNDYDELTHRIEKYRDDFARILDTHTDRLDGHETAFIRHTQDGIGPYHQQLPDLATPQPAREDLPTLQTKAITGGDGTHYLWLDRDVRHVLVIDITGIDNVHRDRVLSAIADHVDEHRFRDHVLND